MKTPDTYTVPGFVGIAIATERPNLIDGEILKVESGETVLDAALVGGTLRALRDALEELRLERGRREAMARSVSYLTGAMKGIQSQLNRLAELSLEDVTSSATAAVYATPTRPVESIDEVMSDDG